jgi:hypothetical protein
MRKLSASKYDLLLYDWTSPEVYERSVMTLTKQTTLVILSRQRKVYFNAAYATITLQSKGLTQKHRKSR